MSEEDTGLEPTTHQLLYRGSSDLARRPDDGNLCGWCGYRRRACNQGDQHRKQIFVTADCAEHLAKNKL